MRILQIVPFLPPSVSGVGDYAVTLARELREQYGLLTIFAVANSEGCIGKHELEGFTVLPFSNAALLEFDSVDRVLLHYVGYGYEKRGCPVALLRALRKLDSGEGKRRLITMFHELYAFGKPWQSSFWTSPLQRWLCREIARLSDEIITSREESGLILGQMTGRDDVINMPIFSSMGEPDVRIPLSKREPFMVIFGGREWRTMSLGRDKLEVLAAFRKWEITKVVEIGGGETEEVDLGVPMQRLGKLPAAEVAIWLSRCRLGFVSYPSNYLEKSSIFASYAAHGVVPVLPERSLMRKTLGVAVGRQYTSAMTGDDSVSFLEQLSQNVFDWYQGNRISQQARTFAKLLRI